jgi:hypothetical protein
MDLAVSGAFSLESRQPSFFLAIFTQSNGSKATLDEYESQNPYIPDNLGAGGHEKRVSHRSG